MSDLRDKLMEAVRVADENESREYFRKGAEDFRWAETVKAGDSADGQTTIYVNDAKFHRNGAGRGYRQKVIDGELLHVLRDVDPNRYRKLRDAADNPDMNRWAQESYKYSLDRGEKRPFDKWYETSRFDQVVGGYLQAGDPDLPTMKNWNRERLPVGKPFRVELERLRKDLGME